MTYAIIETGGKQYKVEEGQVFDVEKLDVEAGDEIEFDVVKAVSTEDSVKVHLELPKNQLKVL